MAVNDIWRVSLVGSHSGTEIAVMTSHWRLKSGVGTFAALAALLKVGLIDNFKTQQATTFRWDMINGLKISPLPKQSATYTTGFPVAGTLAGDEMAHQVAMIMSLRTANAGRSYRGRMFMPACVEGQMTSGIFDAGGVTAMQAAMTAVVGVYGSGGTDPDYEWVVWSDRLSTYTPITAVIVRNNPGTIRRRRIGVGA